MTVGKFILIVMFFSISQYTHAEKVNVAVASNFKNTMQDIIVEFERSTEHHVLLSSGSSGKFYVQIKNGAPFDVFFSADQLVPQTLDNEGFSVLGSRSTYATGALALWSANPKFINNDANRLKSGDFTKLALANPRLAPYGIAAVEVLRSLKLKESTESDWVQGENIAQTYQFVSSGNAEIGFVALSQLMDKSHVKKGSSWVVPQEHYKPINQDVVLLNRGKNNAAAIALLNFIKSDKAQKIIRSYGYTTPASRD